MPIIDHAAEPFDTWRDGVRTRMLISARNGAAELCVFEQLCDPGTGAPLHTHTVEEVLTICDGLADIRLDETTLRLTAGQSVVIAAGRQHGFVNAGTTPLHVRAILAAPIFEALSETGTLRRLWTSD